MFNNHSQILIPDHKPATSIFDILGANKLDVLRATARYAYADSPSLKDIISHDKLIESLKYSHDPDIQFLVNQGYFETKKKLSQDEFAEKYANSGLEYDPNMTDESVLELIEDRKQREINEYIISRGKGGIVESIGKFGVSVIAGNLSPINIGASFIPIGGQARWAAAAAKYGSFKTALAKGFVGGSVGQMAIEPLIHQRRKYEQREYSIQDSAINILESGLFGSSLHGLGYSAKYLKNKYYANSEKLSTDIKTGHNIVDSEFKADLDLVLEESYPNLENLEIDYGLEERGNLATNIKDLNNAKLDLVKKAEQQFPLYFEQKSKIAELEQSLHEQFCTNNNEGNLPTHLRVNLNEEKAKLQLLHEEYINDPIFLEYLVKTQELDKQIINNLKREQFELNAYDLSPEDLYIARSQLNEGKHINLDNPEYAESFYEGADLQEHIASLEHDIDNLSNNLEGCGEQLLLEYKLASMTQDEILKLTQNIIDKIKQGVTGDDLASDLKILSLQDAVLASELKSLHKEITGSLQLGILEKNKQIDKFFANFKEQSFLKKRDYALNLIKQADGERFIRRHANKIKGIKEYLRQVDLRQETISKELLFGLIRDLEKANLVKEFSNIAYNEDIIQELWNITHPDKKPTKSIKAQKIAQIIHKWQTTSVNRANLAGAHITQIEGYITKQTHNSAKLRKVGYKQWLKFTMPLLDQNKTGKLDFKSIFNNLATDTHLADIDEYLNLSFTKNRKSNIADLISVSRKLVFNSASNWLKYQTEFGYYTKINILDRLLDPIHPTKSFIADSVIHNLGSLGKSIGILETLGSCPEAMLDNLRFTFIKELQGKATGNISSNVNSNISSELNGLKSSSKFNNQLELMLGVTPEIPQVNAILGAYRSLKCMSNLGSVVISSFPDAASFISELQNNGVSLLESYASLLKVATFAFNPKEKKEFGQMLGIGVDSLIGGSYSRLGAEYPVAGNIAKATHAFFKLNCMQWWDNTWKTTVGNLLSHNLARQVNTPFKSLYYGLQNLLERYGINESNWYLYKNLVKQVENNKYLIPDMELLTDGLLATHLRKEGKIVNNLNKSRLRQDLTNNLRRYLTDRVDTAITTPHSAEASAMQLGNLGISPRSPMAAVIGCIMQFKTFAYSYMLRPFKSITIDQIPIHKQQGYGLLDVGTWQDIAKSIKSPATLKILPQLLLGTTGFGYLSINALRMLRGQELLEPSDEGVFTASLLKGGGLGLYGDFIFGEYDRYNHNLLEALSGPIGSDIIDIGKIYSKAKNGESEKATELTTQMLTRNIPGRNLFYLQPALFMSW